MCVEECSGTGVYADPNNHLCSGSCTGDLYGDPTNNKCVEICSTLGYYRDPSFYCKDDCNPLRADNITLTCTSECSNGTWGYNYECIERCPTDYYGYLEDRDCYDIANIPDVDLFADNITQTWVE